MLSYLIIFLQTWYFIRGKEIAIKKLNIIFALPGGLDFAGLVFGSTFLAFFPLVLLVLIFFLLQLVPVFVPAALTIQSAELMGKNFTIPALDLSKNHSRDFVVTYLGRGGFVADRGPAPPLRHAVDITLGLNAPMAWSVPEGCNNQCEYSFQFEAIAPKCVDLGPNDISNGNPNDTVRHQAFLFRGQGIDTYYNASLVSQGRDNDPYSFVIAYLDSRHGTEPSKYQAGTSCTFHNATYSVQAKFANFTQTSTVTSVEHHSDPLRYRFDCRSYTEFGDLGNGTYVIPPCYSTIAHTDALITLFSYALYGNAQNAVGVGFSYNFTYATSLFTVNVEGDGSGLALNEHTERIGLSAATQQLFHNLTLSLMSDTITQDNFIQAEGKALLYTTQYSYNSFNLIAIYAASLGLVGISILIGIYVLHQNGEESKNEFANYLVATRNPGLDEVVNGDKKKMEEVKLRYSSAVNSNFKSRRVFTVVDDGKELEEEPESPTTEQSNQLLPRV